MIIDQNEEYWEAQREYDNKNKNYLKSDKGKAMIRKNQLKKKYGITPEQYDELLIKQKGCCAICGIHQTKFKNRLSVDHDHTTGIIRGLLCPTCNWMLGLNKDNVHILIKTILYLEKGENQKDIMPIINDHYDHIKTIQCSSFGCGKIEEFDEETRILEIDNKLLEMGWTIVVTKRYSRYYCPECIKPVEEIGG